MASFMLRSACHRTGGTGCPPCVSTHLLPMCLDGFHQRRQLPCRLPEIGTAARLAAALLKQLIDVRLTRDSQIEIEVTSVRVCSDAQQFLHLFVEVDKTNHFGAGGLVSRFRYVVEDSADRLNHINRRPMATVGKFLPQQHVTVKDAAGRVGDWIVKIFALRQH